jgi:hypothetical protein
MSIIKAAENEELFISWRRVVDLFSEKYSSFFYNSNKKQTRL